MSAYAALPFFLRRSQDVITRGVVTSTNERVHGLLRLEGERLVVQWRVDRHTERVGAGTVRTDHELEPVREVVLPLAALGGATVRYSGWRRLLGPQIVLTAADLRAFEDIAGSAGLRLDHPATLALRVPRSERLAAQEFASELNLALAELTPTLSSSTVRERPADAPLQVPREPAQPPMTSTSSTQ